MNSHDLRRHCHLGAQASRIMEATVDKFGLSARAFFRILKMARTIADLDNAKDIAPIHLSEAIQYRCLDRSNL